MASDLAPFKRRADVLVVGHAFAPERRPVGSLVARVVVGEVDKAIAVFGDRAWTGSVVLENLHADHARLVTSLASVEPRAVVVRAGGRARCGAIRHGLTRIEGFVVGCGVGN